MPSTETYYYRAIIERILKVKPRARIILGSVFASKDDVPRYAVTMGMGNIMRAKALLMIISGNKQEAATKLLIEDRIDPHCPATFMRMHRDATVILEKKLADEIIRNTYRTLMTRGMKGCFVWCCDPLLNEYLKKQAKARGDLA